MSKQPPPAPTASTVGPNPTIIQIVGRPGTGSLPRTITRPPTIARGKIFSAQMGKLRTAIARLNTILMLPDKLMKGKC